MKICISPMLFGLWWLIYQGFLEFNDLFGETDLAGAYFPARKAVIEIVFYKTPLVKYTAKVFYIETNDKKPFCKRHGLTQWTDSEIRLWQ